MSGAPDSPKNGIDAAVLELAGKAGLGRITALQAVKGGANNRVYKAVGAGKSALLKVYFHHPSDPRDRLDAEFSFAAFAWKKGIRVVPEPYACDREAGMALYEWIEGRHLTSREVSWEYVRQALDFFAGLNRYKSEAVLEKASEASFSIAEHVATVQKRVNRLLQIEVRSAPDREALKFVEERLLPTWTAVSASVAHRMTRAGWDIRQTLDPSDKCLSPSDFGFHNALLTKPGVLRFIDFEYAGWDDPAKMICDFFCQPKIPIPGRYLAKCIDAVLGTMENGNAHRDRVSALLNVYRIKWCCIMMNDFLPMDGARRQFADERNDRDTRKKSQLNKARKALGTVRKNMDRGEN